LGALLDGTRERQPLNVGESERREYPEQAFRHVESAVCLGFTAA